MKIVTVLKQVPDAETRIRLDGDAVDVEGVTFVIDGMDEYGVEAALRLREAGHDAEVVAVSCGPARAQEALRTALAMGADRALLLETDAPLDPLAYALALADALREEAPDLVLVGGKQVDWDSAALAPALAEALGWPLSDWTTELEVAGDGLRTRHDRDGGSEALRLPLPAVVSTQQGLNEPRYPTLPNIMKAKRKTLDVRPLRGGAEPRTAVVARELPRRERRGEILDGEPGEAARELARRLREEARVA